jgi:hypothetical protein
MRFFRAILPNLSIALQLALAVLVILDVFNPRIGLLSGLPFVVLFTAAALCAVTTAVVLYRDWRVNR